MTQSPDDQFDDQYDWEDDYTELHLEDATYADFDWDTLDPEITARHDAILDMSPEELDAIDPEVLDDFQRWAAARAWLGHDNPTHFIELTRRILDTPPADRSKLLSYPDLMLALARALAAEGQTPRAMVLLDEYGRQEGADPLELARHRGLLMLEDGRGDEGLKILLDAIKANAADEPEIGLHFAQDLLDLGHKPQARALLEATREIAAARADAELLREVEDTIAAYLAD